MSFLASVFLSPVLLSLYVSLLVLSTECHALSFFSSFLSCLALSVLARFKTISNIFFFNCLLRLSLSLLDSRLFFRPSLFCSLDSLFPLFLSLSLLANTTANSSSNATDETRKSERELL